MSTIPYPLASLSQISQTPSQGDGISSEIEVGLRAYGCKLIQQAGLLLKQNQVAMSTAQILFQRFWYVTSLKQFSVSDIGMGALYLASKLEECPIRMRDLINVYDLLLARAKHSLREDDQPFHYTPMGYFDNAFYDAKDALVVAEMQLLKRLGFDVRARLPYGTMVNYAQVLNLTDAKGKNGQGVPQLAWSYLNDALQTPVYALYPVPTIACAALHLAVRHAGIPLPGDRMDKSAHGPIANDDTDTNAVIDETLSREQELRRKLELRNRETRENDEPVWYTLFDVEREDLEAVAGWVMRLYQPQKSTYEKTIVELVVGGKKSVRAWVDGHAENI
ncbi:Cyclin, N-terminal domain [Rhizoctonia solani]|uniref:Cyclin, N-terminal domain n=1 Tax=Rhizoctonia solani TaxID=456999 RepID=A0A8H8NTM4_9AGAM|nr:Cyclin, N-terminal domain [Rhizoctonia solani]QRW18231.1 Cyclin, N-terminal domain [Rhizoctonia solani]